MTTDKTATVRKLLAKAERAGTEAEAKTYREKATALMVQYSIDEAVLSAAHESTDTITDRRMVIRGGYAKSHIILLNELASVFGVKLIRTQSGSESIVMLYGWESDLALVEVLYASLIVQGMREAKMSHARHRDINGRSWTVSFLIGFTVAVRDRLKAQKADAVQATGDATGTALAVVDRSRAVDAAFRAAHQRTSSSRVKAYAGRSYDSGQAAGNRADLGQGGLGGQRLALAR